MPLFLGYDPGGKDAHGVAAARIAADGTVESKPETRTLRDAEEVCRWVDERHGEAAGLGIDTLLAWSRKGKRACDDMLRRRYGGYGRSVIAQNSLYSAMTVNGALVAMFGRDRGLPLFESHPKLVFHAWLKERKAGTDFARWHAALLRRRNDHEADAFVAAWCASRWCFRAWRVDLYTSEKELVFPAGKAIYPWPERVPSCKPGK